MCPKIRCNSYCFLGSEPKTNTPRRACPVPCPPTLQQNRVQEEDASQPLHLRAWEDICREKAQGGLGIKRIDLVNKSLLIKMAWSIASHQDPYLSAILKAKYYPSNSFWTAPLHTPRPIFWASILKIKNYLHEHSFYQIAKGNTNIWSQLSTLGSLLERYA